jgi:CheY-like chemotaxis protein
MDVSMPEMDGVEATRRIKAEQPAIRVIGLSMLEEAEIAERMRQAGAEAFVNKAEFSAALLRAIYGLASPGSAPGGNRQSSPRPGG